MLEQSTKIGIDEDWFWEKTPTEIKRKADGINYRRKLDSQDKAQFDYILASLICKGISIVLSSKGEFPSIHQVYPDLIEENTTQKMNSSIARFIQFANEQNRKVE